VENFLFYTSFWKNIAIMHRVIGSFSIITFAPRVGLERSKTEEDTRTLNAYLESQQAKVKAAQQALIDAGKMITAESLRDQFMDEEEKSCYLMLLFDEHNENVEALIGNGFEANTLKGHKAILK
jgi:2-succinyl-5-enolpyruvyl-6-hydroxy-3-cyclohexene-1-carboxylate synthase